MYIADVVHVCYTYVCMCNIHTYYYSSLQNNNALYRVVYLINEQIIYIVIGILTCQYYGVINYFAMCFS